jgi:hypothetical protein
MKKTTIGFALLLGALCACHESDDDDGVNSSDAFVTNLIQNTAEDTEPVSLDGVEFQFSEDENAFDALFQ